MLPPIKDIGDFVIMYRELGADEVIIVLPNKDTYESSMEEARTYLHMLGVPDELGAVDYVWNFRGVLVDLNIMTLDPMSLEQAMRFAHEQVTV